MSTGALFIRHQSKSSLYISSCNLDKTDSMYDEQRKSKNTRLSFIFWPLDLTPSLGATGLYIPAKPFGFFLHFATTVAAGRDLLASATTKLR